MSALSPFEEQIASLMPRDRAAEYRATLTAERAMRAKALGLLPEELAEVIGICAEAIRRPLTCRSDLERALVHLNRAISAAAVLDPE